MGYYFSSLTSSPVVTKIDIVLIEFFVKSLIYNETEISSGVPPLLDIPPLKEMSNLSWRTLDIAMVLMDVFNLSLFAAVSFALFVFYFMIFKKVVLKEILTRKNGN